MPRGDHPDSLAEPIRARLFDTLVELRRAAGTQELARLVGRHPNSVRSQLRRLAADGLVESRLVRQARGRPRHAWRVASGARPRQADAELGRWLARTLARGDQLETVETTGREIGRELAPDLAELPAGDGLQDALCALGFAPRAEARPDGAGTRYVLRACPYREAVAESPQVVCTLHRGITQGLLDRLRPTAELTGFVARDPFAAGCVIDVSG